MGAAGVCTRAKARTVVRVGDVAEVLAVLDQTAARPGTA